MKKILALVLAITAIFALAIPAMANGKTTETEFEFDGNNANFHCNDIEGENGRVWPDLTAFGLSDGKNNNGNNKNKTPEKFRVTRVGTSTTWKFDDLAGRKVKCPSCGREDWLTFSNNSGVPNGNNVQFQHDGPSRRYITISIKVTYHLNVAKCKFLCKNAKAVCKFVCKGCGEECKYANDYPLHDCSFKCEKDHDCPITGKDLTCLTVCNCEKYESEVIVNIVNKKELIKIAEGYLFEHTAPFKWKDGTYDSSKGKRIIKEKIYNSKTYEYDVFYKGKGNCKCVCPKAICKAACKPCKFTPPPPHIHVAVCDNCKEGQGSNHKNCERGNPENNTNYFCLTCKIKLASWNGNQGWTPKEAEGTVCKCPTCNP